MKKLSAILLSLLLTVSMLAPCAFAVDFSKDNISVQLDGYRIIVKVTTDADGRMLAYLMDETKEEKYLDGVEINCHPLYDATHLEFLNNLAKNNNFILTCGGDFHNDTYRVKCGVYFENHINEIEELVEFLKETNEIKLKTKKIV